MNGSSNLFQSKKAQEYIQQDIWNPDDFSSQVMDLKNTTANLYDEQKRKNWERESYTDKIKEMTELADTRSLETKREVVSTTISDSMNRANIVDVTTEVVEELADGNNAMPEEMAEQFADAMQEQVEADKINIDEFIRDPELVDLVKKCDIEKLDDASMTTEELKENIKELVQRRTLQLEIDKEDEEPKE